MALHTSLSPFASALLAVFALGCTSKEAAYSGPPPAPLTAAEVEASCGECQFGMEGDGCDLAVRIDGRPYFVKGTGINDHGDSHADDGFCNAIRTARVSGKVEDGVFVASAFEVLPEKR